MQVFGAMGARRQADRFDALLRPHLERLYRPAYRFTGSRDDAEDLVQNLLIKLIPQLQKLEQVDILGPWLARALYNLFVDDARRRAREVSAIGMGTSDVAILDQLIDESSESPEQGAERLLSQRRLAAAWQRLPAEQRAVIAWHDIEGYSLDELAAAHDLPLGTIKSRLHRARARMRRLLTEPATRQSVLDDASYRSKPMIVVASPVFARTVCGLVLAFGLAACGDGGPVRSPITKVFKGSGALRCAGNGVPLATMSMDLTSAGIDVICAQKAFDGLVRCAACGCASGEINVYSIHSQNLSDAEARGFLAVDELPEYQDTACI